MKRFLCIATLILIPTFAPNLAMAENIQYVSDQIRITLRTGQGSNYQIIKTLNSGTKLDVLEITDTGYAHVRLEDGVEGWIRSQYLSEEPIARIVLDSAQKQLDRLKEQNARLREEAGNLRKTNKTLQAERSELSKNLEGANKDLTRLSEVAAKPILLDKENRDLQQRNIAQEKQLQMMDQEIQVLKDRSQREWFMAGAGVLLSGVLFGLLIPKVRWKKKSSWG